MAESTSNEFTTTNIDNSLTVKKEMTSLALTDIPQDIPLRSQLKERFIAWLESKYNKKLEFNLNMNFLFK
jgi:hypothetical protein